jgi:dTDP-4-amino-4,6-dideoxygalactose transaminase
MNVPFGDLTREVAEIREPLNEAINRVIESGWFVLGPEVEAFEEAFARWLGVPHVVGVASGTEAITLALKALGVGEGDEVITAANTCFPTAAGIVGCGATVRLADCYSETLMLSAESVERAITSKTRAIVPVHLYGNCADMDQLRRLADRHALLIVEDCAQAVGARIFDRAAGNFGDANAFSFYPTKNLGAYGDAGCVATASTETAEQLRSIRNYGFLQRDYSVQVGLNSRLDPIQAAILRTKMPYLTSWNQSRASVAQRYREAFEIHGVAMPVTAEYVQNAHHLFPVLLDDREEMRSRLQEKGVQALIHYPTPLHLQPALAGLGYQPGDFPNAEWACDHELSLPIFPHIEDQEVDWVIESVCQAAAAVRVGENDSR